MSYGRCGRLRTFFISGHLTREQKEKFMGYPGSFNKVAADSGISPARYTAIGNTAAAADPAKEPVSFDRVFRDTLFEGDSDSELSNDFGTESITFSAGDEVQKMSTMTRMRDLFFSEELNMFGEDSDLDDTIGFDDIEELDMLADSEAARNRADDEHDELIFSDTE